MEKLLRNQQKKEKQKRIALHRIQEFKNVKWTDDVSHATSKQLQFCFTTFIRETEQKAIKLIQTNIDLGNHPILQMYVCRVLIELIIINEIEYENENMIQ